MKNEAWGRQCAMIAAALPGLFTIEDLYEMDLRDFEFWAREAERAEQMKEVRMASAVRYGFHAEGGVYERYIRDLFGDNGFNGQAQDDRVKDNWNYLKAMKRG